ncbi:hypothetical protein T265_10316 [Opisthorchis viverrini]|uniref:Uncharacterized protein n=1 Tax=Opisthorchis viverrini TaxID=6198 RepID=A0A075A1R1_OPIVI|nr:hypothetical protein T265_10316 [Opisthorchis viverrini]KER21344.1 hypothetical protein T265_10316 [Opisthorchis viverrini]
MLHRTSRVARQPHQLADGVQSPDLQDKSFRSVRQRTVNTPLIMKIGQTNFIQLERRLWVTQLLDDSAIHRRPVMQDPLVLTESLNRTRCGSVEPLHIIAFPVV